MYKDKHKRYLNQARYRKRLRDAVLAFLGGVCVKCGFSDKRALQVDHVNGGGMKEKRSIGDSAMYLKILGNPDGYQILCANCNWIKRFENGEYRKSKFIQQK